MTTFLPDNFKILKQFSKGSNRVFLVETEGKRLIFKEILDKNKREREFETLRILEKYLAKKSAVENFNSLDSKPVNKDNNGQSTTQGLKMMKNGLLLRQIQGKMADDNLDLEKLETEKNKIGNQTKNQNTALEKLEKNYKIIRDSVKLLKQIHEISPQIADKMGFGNKIKTLEIDKINPEIEQKVAKVKLKNPEIGEILKENWQKYTNNSHDLEANLETKVSENNSNLETKITQKTGNLSLCHGDFGLEHIYFETEKNFEKTQEKLENKNSENDLKFTGIIDFGDAIYADFYLDIAHFLLKDADKNFGKSLAKQILESYFEPNSELNLQNSQNETEKRSEKQIKKAKIQTINFEKLRKFGTFWAITRLFEFLENEVLFGKFVSKYLAFLEILKELEMEIKLENSQILKVGKEISENQNLEKYENSTSKINSNNSEKIQTEIIKINLQTEKEIEKLGNLKEF